MTKILVTTSSFAETSKRPLELMAARGLSVTLNPYKRQLTREQARELLVDVDGLVAGSEPLDAGVIDAAKRLRVISRVGTGTDNVDREACQARGIAVFNTPDAHVDAVAELVLGGMLASIRCIAESDRAVRRGEWKKPMGRLLRGNTVGIVGLGRIGKVLVSLLKPFACTIVAYDPFVDAEFAATNGVEYAPLADVVARADVLTLNLNMSAAARNLLSAELIATLKPHAIVVNCARGGLIDEAALAAFLTANPSAGAYLDVFEREPYTGPLTKLENVLLSSHIGSYAREARERMELEAVEGLLRGLDGARGNVEPGGAA